MTSKVSSLLPRTTTAGKQAHSGTTIENQKKRSVPSQSPSPEQEDASIPKIAYAEEHRLCGSRGIP